MSEDLVFYTNPMSRGRVARWMLEEVGRPYRTEVLEFGSTMKAAEYLKINPMGKVPAIRHGTTVVTEAAAICCYLADAFPDVGLAPAPSAPQRGPYYRWMFFTAGPLEAAVTNRSLALEIPAGRERMVGYGRYEDVLDTLERALSEDEYVAGPRFTAADVYVGSQVGWGMQFGTIEPRPAFQRYWQRIADRPARMRATELDDALLPEGTKPPATDSRAQSS
jgi:glutathione S-transferase